MVAACCRYSLSGAGRTDWAGCPTSGSGVSRGRVCCARSAPAWSVKARQPVSAVSSTGMAVSVVSVAAASRAAHPRASSRVRPTATRSAPACCTRTRPVAVSSRVVSAWWGWAAVMTTAVPVLPGWAVTRSSSWPTTGVWAWAGSSSSIRAGQVSSPAWWARAVTVSRCSPVARSIAVNVSAKTASAKAVSARTVCTPCSAAAGAPPPLGCGGCCGAWWGRIRSGLSGASSAAGPVQCTVTPADQGLQAISAAMYRARSAALVGSPVRVTVRSSKLSSHGLPVSVVPTVTSSG